MDSGQKTEFDQGYEAGINSACRWIDQYIGARIDKIDPRKNQRKRDELDSIRKTLIRYINPRFKIEEVP